MASRALVGFKAIVSSRIGLVLTLHWFLFLAASQAFAQTSEKAMVFKDTSHGQLEYIILGKTFGQALFKTEEAGKNSRAHIIALSPTWEVSYYDTNTKKQFLMPLSKLAEATANSRLHPDKKKSVSAGTWNGLKLWKIEFDGLITEDSIMALLCPVKDASGQQKPNHYEYYYTDSIKLTKEQEQFVQAVFSETLDVMPIGLPLGLRTVDDGRSCWRYKAMNLEEKQIERSKLKYPQTYEKCSSLDAISFDKNKMESIESLGDSMQIGKTMNHPTNSANKVSK